MNWACLEEVRGLVAVPAVWRARLRADYETFSKAFLRKRPEAARSVPCPRECGCAHEVVKHDDGRLVAVCQCEPWNCEDMAVTAEDIVLRELSLPKLGRALAHALAIPPREMKLGLPSAIQFAAFGSAALPIIFIAAPDEYGFHQSLLDVASRLPERFAVLTPTSCHWTGRNLEFVERRRAGLFDLNSEITLLENGALRARLPGAELFARLLPEKETAITESEAVRVFELSKRLNDGPKPRKAPLSYVFQRLVLDGVSQDTVARECECVPGLISLRVDEIESRMHLRLDRLQALASRVAEIKATEEDGDQSSRPDRNQSEDAPEE